MDLKDFISGTLSQLIDGVIDAQNKVQSVGRSGGRVNPHVRTPHPDASIYGVTNDKLPVIFVDFDVSLVAQEGTGTKGGIGVVTGFLALGSQGESKEQVQTSRKIKFRIPVALPLQPYTAAEDDKS
jgi:hypothetical protein